MKYCFDTPVLAAALLKQHPRHASAFPRLKAVQDGSVKGAITTHTLAELFAVLTSLPAGEKLLPHEARQLIRRNVYGLFEIIALTPKIYAHALDLTAHQGLSSAAIFDALQFASARSASCDKLLTFNLKHFRSLSPSDPMIVQP